jgi:sugar phosphate isomerase/epimerase
MRAHDLGKMSLSAHHDALTSLGFDAAQLVFKKALTDHIDLDDLEWIRRDFPHVDIMMLGAYFNPVHPDSKVVQEGIANFKKHLEIAPKIGAMTVGTETGSLMGNPWGYVPDNHLPQTLDRVIQIMRDLVSTAEHHHTHIAIEGAYNHVMYDPERVSYLLTQSPSPNLLVTVDLFNFLHIGNVDQSLLILDECLARFADKIKIYHLKDFVVTEGQIRQVPPGQGNLDYPAIIERIKHTTPDAYLIFEGVGKNDIIPSFRYIRELVERS